MGRGINSDSRYDGARQGRAYSKYQARNACKNIETDNCDEDRVAWKGCIARSEGCEGAYEREKDDGDSEAD